MTSAPVRLRRAGGEEAGSLAELWLASRRAAPGVPPPAHSEEEVRAWFAEMVSSGEVWVAACASGRPAAVMVLDGESVEQLYVLPGCRRQGFGSALLQMAQATHDSLTLWTFEANAPARAFYEAHGFAAQGEACSENEERAPALLYRWSRGGG